ncbi:MAG: hypothetical protein U0228_10035 [Myxococcaceae bacterium]
MASRIQQVHSLDALLAPFTREVNARCFSRTLTGDFEAVARQLATDGVLEVDAELLQSAPGLDAAAVRVLLDDLAWLTSLGREPQLNVITHYPKDTRGLPITVDVHSFHVDSAPVEADTFLCTYAGACSEGSRTKRRCGSSTSPPCRQRCVRRAWKLKPTTSTCTSPRRQARSRSPSASVRSGGSRSIGRARRACPASTGRPRGTAGRACC